MRISFFATDKNNRPVDRIDKNDFAIVDGEMVIRDFRSLRKSDETRLDIVVLVDTSESVGSGFRATSANVLRLLSDNSLASGDRISIITFAGLKPSVLCVDECPRSIVDEKLRTVQPTGSTPLFDSLTLATKFLGTRHTGGVQQVLLVFSDGNDTISNTSPRETLEALASSGVLLYSVNVQPFDSEVNGKYWLQQIAEATGGRTFQMQDGTAHVLESVLADLRASYVVTYQLPSRELGFHSLRILPKHNLSLHFHCRRGYFYEEVQ